ncbi:MAG: ABC transporter permease [Hyphomonadaceae bacterium]|nr:ABC transporter permease [Hyphomonadaceae bacterium]
MSDAGVTEEVPRKPAAVPAPRSNRPTVHATRHRAGFIRANARLLKDVWVFRRQIFMVFWRDFNAPHMRSVLGTAWAYIMPMLPVSAYLLLRTVIKVPDEADTQLIDPVIFTTMGVTLWMLLRDGVMTPSASIRKYRNLVAGARFPMIGAIVVGFGQVALETLIRAALCAAAIIALGSYSLAGLLPAAGILACAMVLTFSVGVILVPIISAVPDVQNLLQILFRYLIFFSGAIWPVPTLFGSDALYRYNPFSLFLGQTREAVVLGTMSDFQLILPFLIATPIVLLIAGRIFYALQPQIKESVSG